MAKMRLEFDFDFDIVDLFALAECENFLVAFNAVYLQTALRDMGFG